MGCGCGGNNSSNPISEDCSDITSTILIGYKAKFQCVKDNNYYAQTGYTSAYIQARIDLLSDIINDKIAIPTSCRYNAYIYYISQEVAMITNTTNC
jgi:hypothetical protein